MKSTIKGNIKNVFGYLNYKNIKTKPLLRKVLYTLIIIAIFRVAASITTPGVVVSKDFASDQGSFLGILNMMGGGGLSRLSIVALGIGPFITASIIMQLLQSEAFPPLYRLSKSGPAGKRKINIITRSLTMVFAVLQSIMMINQFATVGSGGLTLADGFDSDLYKFFVLPMVLVGGSLFTLFLGEQITNKGIGNGTSLIIFSGIAVALPDQFKNAWYVLSHERDTLIFIQYRSDIEVDKIKAAMSFLIYIVSFLVMLYVVTFIYKSERHIPIQQSGSGMTTDAKQMSRLPIKLNPSGVMPVIFSMMLMTIPAQIAQIFDEKNTGRIWIMKNLNLTSPIGMTLLIVFIFLFSIVMSLVTFNPLRVSENFKKQGTFIPGVRPGEETEDYITGVVTRLSIFSGVYLSLITIFKYVMQIIIKNQTNFSNAKASSISFGGTTMLILVSVAVETIGQLQARDTTNKISRARKVSLNKNDGNGGLLW